MSDLTRLILMCCCVLSLAGCAVFNDHTPSDEHRYEASNRKHLRSLRQLAVSPSILHQLQTAHDQEPLTQGSIDEIDTAWQEEDPSVEPLVQSVLQNHVASYLRRVQRVFPEYLELMVIDDQGCLTAANLRTSDYWQGDEAKWQEIFHHPEREYAIAEVKLDVSVNAYLHHYSLPVRSKQGDLLGVLVVGVAMD